MITNTDLVEWQLRAAAGEKLPVTQEDLKLSGWSFEARIYAEDPNNSFMPGAGPLEYLATPAPADDVRIETGVRQSDQVSVHYDPMIAKLVVWGPDRLSALLKLRACLAEFNIAGLSTNVDFLMDLASHPEFVAGNVDTEFIPRHYDSLFPEKPHQPTSLCTAVLASVLTDKQGSAPAFDPTSPFTSLTGARFNHSLYRTVKLVHEGVQHSVGVSAQGGGQYLVTVGDASYKVGGRLVPKYQLQGGSSGGAGDAVAPMPGVIEKVMVEEGAAVAAGDPLMVMIAMKMEYVIKAPAAGTVSRVAGKVGDFVEKNKVLVAFQAEE